MRSTRIQNSRHDRVSTRAEQSTQGILAQPVLHVADKAANRRRFKANEARLSRRMEDERAKQAGARPRPQPHDGARRQVYWFSARSARPTAKLPADGAAPHDRHEREAYRA